MRLSVLAGLMLILIVGGPLMPRCHHIHCDMIEVNHVHDKKGNLIFSQVIIWKIEPSDGKLHNHGWKMIKHPWDQPISCARESWEVWHVCERGQLTITAPCFRVRSTNEDMERKDTREFWGGSAPNLFSMEKEVKVSDE